MLDDDKSVWACVFAIFFGVCDCDCDVCVCVKRACERGLFVCDDIHPICWLLNAVSGSVFRIKQARKDCSIPNLFFISTPPCSVLFPCSGSSRPMTALLLRAFLASVQRPPFLMSQSTRDPSSPRSRRRADDEQTVYRQLHRPAKHAKYQARGVCV